MPKSFRNPLWCSLLSGVALVGSVRLFWRVLRFLCVKIDYVRAQCVCIKFCFKLGKTAAETHRMLKQAYGNKALSQSQTYNVQADFKNGRTSVQNDDRSGSSSAVTTPELNFVRWIKHEEDFNQILPKIVEWGQEAAPRRCLQWALRTGKKWPINQTTVLPVRDPIVASTKSQWWSRLSTLNGVPYCALGAGFERT